MITPFLTNDNDSAILNTVINKRLSSSQKRNSFPSFTLLLSKILKYDIKNYKKPENVTLDKLHLFVSWLISLLLNRASR